MKRVCLWCFFLCLLTWPWPVAAQSDRATLVVTLLDQADQPLAGTEITLILIRYGELAVETKAYSICKTDFAGQCTFEMSNPPRLADGSAEAYLDVTGSGRRWINWQGQQVEITLKVADLELLATVSVPNELGYEYETPGAYNSPPYTESPATPTEPTTHTVQTQVPDGWLEKQDDLPKSAESETQGFQVGILPLASGVVFAAILAWILRASYVRRGQG